MLLSLLLIPILGLFSIVINKDNELSVYNIKLLALVVSTLNLFISLVIFILFDFSTNQFQFVQEYHEISYYDFYLGIDGLSIYFTLLTTLIIPIALVSNWNSIKEDVDFYVTIILLLESLLLVVFLILDILLFYIFFESILPPLFILIGIFGSDNRVKASFYLFLYTLLGSLFLLLSILAMSSIMSTTDYDTLFKGNFIYLTQLFLFYGIFIAFAVKTPTIFLNTWLLKAHVESPLGGSIILAAIVLKLSLYGILRLILPILPKAYILYTYIIFLIGVITIIYASLSTVRTIDVKELIAYSSVSHAAVYLLGVFSNTIQGIEGAINLGLAHGLVSPGLFISAGGVLYDRSSTRVISFYRGVTQVMPLFSILFFLLCLANCGAPLSLNFVGEFLSLYGVFERSSLFGVFASSSIIFSAAYTIYMYQRIAFGGVYSRMFIFSIPDLTKREFTVLLALVVPTVLFGIYPAVILDAVHYSVSTLIYSVDSSVISCDSSMAWEHYFQNNASFYHSCFAISFWIAVLTIAIKNKDIVKSLIYKWGRLIFYLILGSFSLSTFILIMYAIYMLYVSYCIITEAIFNGLFTSHHAEHYCIATEMDSELIEKNSLFVKGRDNVFLTSTGDQSSNPTGNHVGVQGPQPTGNVQAQGPQPTGNVQAQGTQPTGNVQAQGWHRLETPVRWMDQDGYIQTRFWIDPQGEYRLIGPGPHRPHVPWPPREWEPVGGQGDNPVYFTKARQGEELTHRNTFNTREGYINYCESKRGDHRWSTVDTHNLEENNGFCFNCREKTRNMHYSCWNCYRHVCTRCDSTYDMHAFRNFTDRMNDWTKNEIKKPRSR